MFKPSRSIVVRALLLGVSAGMRSLTPGAVLAWHQPSAPRSARWRTWPILRNPWGRRLMVASGAGETVIDKLPITPPRLESRSLVVRLMLGVFAGAAIGSEGKGKSSLMKGAISGLVGAAIGNVAGYHARKTVVETTGVRDPAVAVFEDAIAITLANNAVTSR